MSEREEIETKLYRYFAKELAEGKIDFRIRADHRENQIVFYIHPIGKNGDTLNLQVTEKPHTPKSQEVELKEELQKARIALNTIMGKDGGGGTHYDTGSPCCRCGCGFGYVPGPPIKELTKIEGIGTVWIRRPPRRDSFWSELMLLVAAVLFIAAVICKSI